MKTAPNYHTIKEYWVKEKFSLRGSVWGCKPFRPSDQCFCNTTKRCEPEQTCTDCNLDRSGECNQSVESNVPGV